MFSSVICGWPRQGVTVVESQAVSRIAVLTPITHGLFARN